MTGAECRPASSAKSFSIQWSFGVVICGRGWKLGNTSSSSGSLPARLGEMSETPVIRQSDSAGAALMNRSAAIAV